MPAGSASVFAPSAHAPVRAHRASTAAARKNDLSFKAKTSYGLIERVENKLSKSTYLVECPVLIAFVSRSIMTAAPFRYA